MPRAPVWRSTPGDAIIGFLLGTPKNATAWTGRRLLALVFLLTLPLVTPRLRASDEIEYFAYLRSLVFDQDLDFENEYRHFYEQNPEGPARASTTPSWSYGTRSRAGGSTSARWALRSCGRPSTSGPPAHARRAASGFSTVPADGLSWPYVAAACYGSAVLASWASS